MVIVLESLEKKVAENKPVEASAPVKMGVPTRDGLVAIMPYAVRKGLIRDGEQHWVGGYVDYSPSGHDVDSEPDSDYEMPEDSEYQLVEHQQNQNF